MSLYIHVLTTAGDPRIYMSTNIEFVLKPPAYSSKQMSSPPVFSGVRFTRFLVLCVCFVDRFLSFCTFSFGHCVVCSSSIYGFWLPLWYLQTLFTVNLEKLKVQDPELVMQTKQVSTGILTSLLIIDTIHGAHVV